MHLLTKKATNQGNFEDKIVISMAIKAISLINNMVSLTQPENNEHFFYIC